MRAVRASSEHGISLEQPVKVRRSIVMRAVFGSTKILRKNLARNGPDPEEVTQPQLLFTAQAVSAIAVALKVLAGTRERAKRKMFGAEAELETREDPALTFGKRQAQAAARNPVNLADGEMLPPKFAAAVPREVVRVRWR